jgi:hypothetical protein
MTPPPHPAPGEQSCHGCGAPLAADQHWCVMCGARRAGARTDALALLFGTRDAGAADPSPLPPGTTVTAAAAAPRALTAGRRRRAALPVALASLVGLVVVTGSNVPASLAGAGQPPFTVVLPAQVAAQVAQTPPAAGPAPLDEVADVPLDDTPVADVPVTETPAATEETPAASDETPAGEDPPADTPAGESPIRHVFLVVLGSTDVAALAQDEAVAPYLAGTLAKSGTLLSEYSTVARGALANRIALVSGQGPTQQTLADCTTYADVRPADPLDDGQTGGDGCVYGYETGTIGDQLRGLERTWRAYVEPAAPVAGTAAHDRRAAAARTAADARAADAGPVARAAAACRTDVDTTRRNPFLWFRGTFEADDCDEHNVPLTQLARDLEDEETTPALSYIASDAQLGSAEADRFLERVVPQILNSLAYANGGLVVITSDQPPASETPPTPAPTPPATTTPAAPPSTTPTEPPPSTVPVDPPPTTTPTTPQDPPPSTTATLPPTTTPTLPPTTTPTLPPTTASTTPPDARAAADLPPGPTRYANVGDAAAAGAGVSVGALLISPYTPSNSVDRTPSNAFTLLSTLEQMFGVDPLGYAAADGVEPLPDRLFSVTP